MMTLSEFVTAETRNLIEFSAKWRKLNADKPETYPLDLHSNFSWFRQYMAYCANKMEFLVQEQKKLLEQKTDANKDAA